MKILARCQFCLLTTEREGATHFLYIFLESRLTKNMTIEKYFKIGKFYKIYLCSVSFFMS